MGGAVLCVDDDPGMLVAFQRFLEPGFAVTTASSGEEALDVLADGGPFAVVVSDLEMSGMGGVEFLAATREKCPDAVRVLLTGQLDLPTPSRRSTTATSSAS